MSAPFTLSLDDLLGSAPTASTAPAAAATPEGGAREDTPGGLPLTAVNRSLPADDAEFDFDARPVYRSLDVAAPAPGIAPVLPADYSPSPSSSWRGSDAALPPAVPIVGLEATHVAVNAGVTPHRAMGALRAALKSCAYPVDETPAAFASSLCATVNCAAVHAEASLFMRRAGAGPATLVLELQRRGGCRAGFRQLWFDLASALAASGVAAKPATLHAPRKFAPKPVPASLERAAAAAVPPASPVDHFVGQLRSGFVGVQRQGATGLAQVTAATPESAAVAVDALVDTAATACDPLVLASTAAALANVIASAAVASLAHPAAAAAGLLRIVGAGGEPTLHTLHARREAARGLATMAKSPALLGAVREACTPEAVHNVESVCRHTRDASLLRHAHEALRMVTA